MTVPSVAFWDETNVDLLKRNVKHLENVTLWVRSHTVFMSSTYSERVNWPGRL